MTKPLIAVLLMALVTYIPRSAPLVLFKKEITSKRIRAFLNYVPYAVLAAMTFPDILYSTSNYISAIAGTCTALLLSFYEKSLIVVAIGAILTVFAAEIILTQI